MLFALEENADDCLVVGRRASKIAPRYTKHPYIGSGGARQSPMIVWVLHEEHMIASSVDATISATSGWSVLSAAVNSSSEGGCERC